MTDQPSLKSAIANLLSTLQGKIVSLLAIIALVLGIIAEAINIHISWEENTIKTIEAERQRQKASVSLRPIAGKMSKEAMTQQLCNDYEMRVEKPSFLHCEEDGLKEQAEAEFELRHYDDSFDHYQKYAAAIQAFEIKASGKAGKLTQSVLSSLSFHALFARNFNEALAASERSSELSASDLMSKTNQAHALMFLGRNAEAKALYLAHRYKSMGGHNWNYYVLDDYKQFRAAGLIAPLMADIETLLKEGSK